MWQCAAIIITIMYIVMMSGLSIARHAGLRTQMNDLGNMTQAIWGVSQGDLTMRVTNDPDGEIRSRLGVHTNFIFYLIAVPFIVVPALVEYMEWTLLVLTSVASGLTGLGIFTFGKLELGSASRLPLVLAIAFWLNPMVHDANLYDFHAITLTACFLVWMLVAWRAGYEKLGWCLFFLAIACKEDVAFILFMLGIGETIWGNRKRGIMILGTSTVYVVLLFSLFIPIVNFGQALPKVASGRLGWLGDTPSECLVTIITEPTKVLNVVLRYDHIRLPIFLYFIGGVFALFGGFRALIGVIPPVSVALISGNDWMTRITGTYYWIPAVALIYIGCVLALSGQFPLFRKVGAGYLLCVSAIGCILLSQTPLGLFSEVSDFRVTAEYRSVIKDIEREVGDASAVSGQNNIAAHFSKRRTIAVYPSRAKDADYLIFHLRSPAGPNPRLFPSNSARQLIRMSPEQHIAVVTELMESPEWELSICREGFFLFGRADQDGRRNELGVNLDQERALYLATGSPIKEGRFEKWIIELLGY